MGASAMAAPLPAPRATGRPLILGHRGASHEAPENTLSAFRRALAQGADGVELDVWRCGTGEVVVFHDEDAQRIAGSPLRIREASLTELRRLDLGRGERIPRLEEVLEALPGAVVNVELKSGRVGDPRLARQVGQILGERRNEQRVVVSSFDHVLLGAFRLAAPRVPVGLLFEARSGWRLRLAVAEPILRPSALHPERVLATDGRMRAWARQGYAVYVWTVDEPGEVERLCALGAAAVITNSPRIAREAVRRATGR
jgi:glycerophosphoryl diester phosphodiesterase